MLSISGLRAGPSSGGGCRRTQVKRSRAVENICTGPTWRTLWWSYAGQGGEVRRQRSTGGIRKTEVGFQNVAYCADGTFQLDCFRLWRRGRCAQLSNLTGARGEPHLEEGDAHGRTSAGVTRKLGVSSGCDLTGVAPHHGTANLNE